MLYLMGIDIVLNFTRECEILPEPRYGLSKIAENVVGPLIII